MSVDAADVGVCATWFAEPSFYHELRSLVGLPLIMTRPKRKTVGLATRR